MANINASEHARELSKLGSSKGGKARKSVLTPEQRTEIARNAVQVRWRKAKGEDYSAEQVSDVLDQARNGDSEQVSDTVPKTYKTPYSQFPGNLELSPEISLPCHVLDTGAHVIAQREVVKAITGIEKGNLDRYLTANNLAPYFDGLKVSERTIGFALPGTNMEGIGYEATLLIDICDAYLRARDAKALNSQQRQLAQRAEIIVRACAKVGILALIDEATGYQEVRAKNALQLKLQAFIAEEMQEWARLFPDQFWIELARLENIRYSPRSRPLRWGKYVMAFVYDAVDRDVGGELRILNPDPHYGKNHHQWLTPWGRQVVRDHINQVIGIMKTCRDMDDFNRKFGHVFNKSPMQLTFFDMAEYAH